VGHKKIEQMKLRIFFLLLIFANSSVIAQKFGYIDSEYILSKMPEYKTATEQMNQVTEKWSKDIETKYGEIQKLKEKYQQEEILLTADMKKEKLAEIETKEEDFKKLNNSVFGVNGLLFQKKKEILKPIMEEIYKSSEKIARKYKLSFIFDKASDMSMMYADPRHDYTDYLIEELGLNLKNEK
jgi:outer membrane protein